MNNRSKNNSIIFLTTLSVYLGLVLVGGAMPTVLAQAATTRNFNVQDEIEVKDDLDKNPEKNEELSADVELVKRLNIVQAIGIFLEDLRKLESIDKFNPQKEWNFSHKVWLEEYDSTNSTSTNSDIDNPWLRTAIEQLTSTAVPESFSSISDYLPICERSSCRQSNIKVESNNNEFSLSFTFTRSNAEKAQLTAKAFEKFFAEQKIEQKNSFDSKIYENAKVTSENNQVFIVTRLPRGSLDDLLKQDAKAEK